MQIQRISSRQVQVTLDANETFYDVFQTALSQLCIYTHVHVIASSYDFWFEFDDWTSLKVKNANNVPNHVLAYIRDYEVPEDLPTFVAPEGTRFFVMNCLDGTHWVYTHDGSHDAQRVYELCEASENCMNVSDLMDMYVEVLTYLDENMD